jgi:hypothetical protein
MVGDYLDEGRVGTEVQMQELTDGVHRQQVTFLEEEEDWACQVMDCVVEWRGEGRHRHRTNAGELEEESKVLLELLPVASGVREL